MRTGHENDREKCDCSCHDGSGMTVKHAVACCENGYRRKRGKVKRMIGQ